MRVCGGDCDGSVRGVGIVFLGVVVMWGLDSCGVIGDGLPMGVRFWWERCCKGWSEGWEWDGSGVLWQ